MYAVIPTCLPRAWVRAEAVDLRKNRQHSRWKSRAALRFRKCADDECSGFRDLVDVCEQLDLIVVGTQNVTLKRIVVLGGGDSWIGIGGLVTGGGNFSLLIQIFEGR